jgi:hypothetical protein
MKNGRKRPPCNGSLSTDNHLTYLKTTMLIRIVFTFKDVLIFKYPHHFHLYSRQKFHPYYRKKATEVKVPKTTEKPTLHFPFFLTA